MKRRNVEDVDGVLRVRATPQDASVQIRALNLSQRIGQPGQGPLLTERERDLLLIAIAQVLKIGD